MRQTGWNETAQQGELLFQTSEHPYLSLPLGVTLPAPETTAKCGRKRPGENLTLGFMSAPPRRCFHQNSVSFPIAP